MTTIHDIFVYGSLLKGESNHRLLAAAEFVGPGMTLPEYRLVDLGLYPGVVAGGTIAIMGEVYRVPVRLMPALDALEDHPDVYVRTPIRLAEGGEVLMYILHPHLAEGRKEVPSGDWRAYRRTRDGR
jgi:gamma-glutamylaminecyclotransferase